MAKNRIVESEAYHPGSMRQQWAHFSQKFSTEMLVEQYLEAEYSDLIFSNTWKIKHHSETFSHY